MEKIEFKRDHDLGWFSLHNPDWRCVGVMGGRIAVYCYEEEGTYRQYEFLDMYRFSPENESFLQRIFELELEISDCNTWTVTMSRVDQLYRGFKVAPKLYRWIMMQEDIVLQAGDEQSPGGRAIWHSLASMKDVLVYGKTYKTPLVRCSPCDFETEIIVDDCIKTYGGSEHFVAFACYSPERMLRR